MEKEYGSAMGTGEMEQLLEEAFGHVAKSTVKFRSRRYLYEHPEKVKKIVRTYHGAFAADDILAMYDESLFANGAAGLIFTREGIALDYGFEKIHIPYRGMRRLYTGYESLVGRVVYIESVGAMGKLREVSISENYYDVDRLCSLLSRLSGVKQKNLKEVIAEKIEDGIREFNEKWG